MNVTDPFTLSHAEGLIDMAVLAAQIAIQSSASLLQFR
jgi:hypothetical protein